MCVRYTNLVDRHIGVLAACLQVLTRVRVRALLFCCVCYIRIVQHSNCTVLPCTILQCATLHCATLYCNIPCFHSFIISIYNKHTHTHTHTNTHRTQVFSYANTPSSSSPSCCFRTTSSGGAFCSSDSSLLLLVRTYARTDDGCSFF